MLYALNHVYYCKMILANRILTNKLQVLTAINVAANDDTEVCKEGNDRLQEHKKHRLKYHRTIDNIRPISLVYNTTVTIL